MYLVLLLLTSSLSTACARPSPELDERDFIIPGRDPRHPLFEVVAIIGAYIIWILITILLILFVGRRLRLRNTTVTTESSSKLRPFKLQGRPGSDELRLDPTDMRTSPNGANSSPKEKTKLPRIRSWKTKGRKSQGSVMSISSAGSAPVDEAHRSRNAAELGDLYAHVMVFEEQRETSPKAESTTQTPELDQKIAEHDEEDVEYPDDLSQQLEDEQLYNTNKLSHPLAPTPVDDHFPQDEFRRAKRKTYDSRRSKPLSILSELSARAGAILSPRSPFTPRSITSPMRSRMNARDVEMNESFEPPDLPDNNMYTDNVPLSPRLYNPGPLPPTPDHIRYQNYNPTIPEEGENEYEESGRRPRSKDRKAPPVLSLRSAAMNNAAAGGSMSAKPLPFREHYGDHSLNSAPPTRTTFVERNVGIDTGPKTGAIVPSTPYSVYTPHTPMVPVTPDHLVSRDEMKRNKKEAKLRVLDEDDLVVPEDKGF